MSNTNLKDKYAALVELKKKQMEFVFTPATENVKKPVKEIRAIKEQVAKLQKELAQLRCKNVKNNKERGSK